MATELFVGGPLHGELLAVPDDLTHYRHAVPLPPEDGESWPARVRLQETVYVRRYYTDGKERLVSFSVDGATDADLAAALLTPPKPRE